MKAAMPLLTKTDTLKSTIGRQIAAPTSDGVKASCGGGLWRPRAAVTGCERVRRVGWALAPTGIWYTI